MDINVANAANNNTVFIALGSNIDDREFYLKSAINLIAGIKDTCIECISNIYETEPVGFVEQNSFLNMVIRINTGLKPLDLLERLKAIEIEHKRVRTIKWGPRTIDIDILMYQNEIYDSENLTLPHPRMKERAFVMVPLLDVVNKGTKEFDEFSEIANKCKDFNGVKIYKHWNNCIGNVIIRLSEVESTNDFLKEKGMNGVLSGTIVLTDIQTKGKGRLGRDWSSMNTDGIWMSMLLRPDNKINSIANITLLFAVSIVETLNEVCDIQCSIKWPNDIILEGKKVCGILSESNFIGNSCNFVVIGMGINVNQDSFQEDLSNIAISLKNHSGIVYDKDEIINKLIENSDRMYIDYKMGNMNLIQKYRKYSITIGREIKIISHQGEKKCIAYDINEQGNLIVKNVDGSMEEVISGEVSVRGICNYN
jgi:BirA family biotin operon repressor/biotin-[acetyl-CoA-carboxylase] ligase